MLRHLAVGALSICARVPEEVPELVDRYAGRELVVTPYSLRRLVEMGTFDRLLTVKVVAGPVPENLASAAIDAFPRARIVSLYGATELGSAVFARVVRRRASDALGVPVRGTRVRIVDDQGTVVPGGTAGEIQVSRGDGWTGTGDLGYLDKLGGAHLVGRVKELVFLPSGRTTPERIEDQILALPLVEDCAVAVVDSAEGWDRIGVCVVLTEPRREPEVAVELAGLGLPVVRVRCVPAIPRTALGKPMRAQLWRLLTEPAAVPPG